jgi:hypothetical protein
MSLNQVNEDPKKTVIPVIVDADLAAFATDEYRYKAFRTKRWTALLLKVVSIIAGAIGVVVPLTGLLVD